jgi:hypothetical protein
MFCLWQRIAEGDRRRVWRLYGWFSALMVCGSCFGAATWVLRMMQFSYYIKSLRSSDVIEQYSMLALSYSYRPSFTVTYAVEFLCLSVAKLLVLDRMSDFSVPESDSLRKRVLIAWWCVLVGVVLGNSIGLLTNIVAAVFFQKAANAISAASSYYIAGNISIGNDYYQLHREELQRAFSISSVQMFCEVSVLLLIVSAFAAAGVMCALRISSSLREVRLLNAAGAAATSEAVVSGRRLRFQVVLTTAAVFFAFVLRSVFSTMYAVAYELQNSGNSKNCDVGLSFCDDQCYNVYTHILQWMSLTPEFQLMIVLLSSPVALLIALWGMTSETALRLMGLATPLFAATQPLITRG